MIIAVDGPTASGKGTIARALAAHFGLPHLDTGLLYRAVGRQVALSGGNPDDEGPFLLIPYQGYIETAGERIHIGDCAMVNSLANVVFKGACIVVKPVVA